VIPGDADHSFRGDPDQFDQDRRKTDHDARKGDRDPPERFPQGEMTLDITEGKLFLHLIYGETECQPGDCPWNVPADVMWPRGPAFQQINADCTWSAT